MLSTLTGPTLVQVVAPHCAECRAMQPDLDAVAGEFGSVDLVVVDATERPDVTRELRVLGTPTLIAVRNGQELARFTGRRTRNELREMFSAVAAGDPGSLPRFGRGDRTVWTVAGAAMAVAGLAMGPAWPLVAIGAAVAGYANIPRR